MRRVRTIGILVNNAGIQRDAPFVELTLAQWNKVLAVNLTGQDALWAAKATLRRGLAAPGLGRMSLPGGSGLILDAEHGALDPLDRLLRQVAPH